METIDFLGFTIQCSLACIIVKTSLLSLIMVNTYMITKRISKIFKIFKRTTRIARM